MSDADEIEKLKRLVGFDEREINPDMLDFLKRNFAEKSITPLLRSVLRRRGVVFYFNSSLIDYDSRPGYESEDEMLVTLNRPLTIDVLIGAQPLSSFDMPEK